jgi:hypothetical protein
LYLVKFDKETGKEEDVLRENRMELRKSGKIKHQVIQDKVFFQKELRRIHPFVIKRFEVARLYFITYFKVLSFCCCRNKKAKKLKQLLNLGKEQLNADLSLQKIIKTIRNLKMHFKQHVLTNQLSFELRYNNPSNVINLDSD